MSDADGGEIEAGEAVESSGGSGRWVYRATAVDRPGGTDEGVASKVV